MYAIYKRGNFGDWAQYVEIFGQPVRIMYYDAYDTQTKQELKQVLNESGSSLAMMIPKQAEFTILDGKSSNGYGKLQDGFKEACNNEMSICILGNTETSSSSKSSGYAQAKEHGEQQDEIIFADLIFVENMLNSEKFLQILKSYGYAVEGGSFSYEAAQDLNALKTRMEIDGFVASKVPVGDDYWYETYGIPKPENYEKLKAEMAEAKDQPSENNENKASENTDEKAQKPDEKPKQLTEHKKANLMDKFFNGLADFFAQAQP
jgi:phage gp29-like protein